MTPTKYAIKCSTEEQARELISVYKEKGFFVPGKKHRTKELLFEIDNTGFHVVRPTTIGTNYVVITYEEAKELKLLGNKKECFYCGESKCNCEQQEIIERHIADNKPQQEEDVIEKIQKQINNLSDEDKEKLSDGYHTFKELYEHRVALFIRLINETNEKGKYRWVKSKLHFDGSGYDGWFIVMGYINGKQISYHLPICMREKVNCMVGETADGRDGHTPKDVVERLLS